MNIRPTDPNVSFEENIVLNLSSVIALAPEDFRLSLPSDTCPEAEGSGAGGEASGASESGASTCRLYPPEL